MTETQNPPIAEMFEAMRDALRSEGLEGLDPEGCTAEDYAIEIADNLMAQGYYPLMEFDKVIEAITPEIRSYMR